MSMYMDNVPLQPNIILYKSGVVEQVRGGGAGQGVAEQVKE